MNVKDVKPKACPYCDSSRVQKVGFVPSVSEGRQKQRYRCGDCGKSFFGQKKPETE